jgi:hypothetical protein
MKNPLRTIKNSLFVTALILLAGCATYKPTIIDNNYEGTLSDIISYDKVGILCAYYSLASVDNLTDSKETSFKHDQKLAKNVVDAELKVLCAQNSSCYENYYTTNDISEINSDKYIDLKIHQYVNWGQICIMIFPVYYTLNESYCVTADIYENKMRTKQVVEWGYIKMSGFWVFDFGDTPNGNALRSYLVKKVLNQAIKEI